jgi:predicted  nucleic acid-binding Zn-ribbon protein
VLTDDLLELQRLDTTADQLARRRAQLPERTAANEAGARRQDNRDRHVQAVSRDQELELCIDALERDGEALAAQRNRLESQLRTVTAPREAEALMHELETIAARRDELDDQELAYLEEQSELAEEVTRLDAAFPELEAAASAAGAALQAADAAIADELAALASARAEIAGRLDAASVERYERLKERFGGVAVARLEGSRCGGCHLDLSRSELDTVRAVGPGEFADCPQCGRLLVP